MQEITQKTVRELFDYRDGFLYWKTIGVKNQVKVGDKAGSISSSHGYYSVKINGKSYYNHRIIYLYYHGILPKFLDHIDNDPLNNQIENLRAATKSQNGMNQPPQKNTSSQYKGVSWSKNANKWQTHLQIDGKPKHLGYFTNEMSAAFIYNVYAREAFGEFVNLNEMGIK